MKRQILLGMMIGMLCIADANAWFGNSEAERRIEVQQELVQQKKQTGTWQGIAFVLGLSCVFTLVAGTMAGSKARKDSHGRIS